MLAGKPWRCCLTRACSAAHLPPSRAGLSCVLDRQDANTVARDTLVGMLTAGQEVTARVTRIEFDALRLRLGSSSRYLADTFAWEQHLAESDPYYHVLTEGERREADRKLQARPCSHLRAPCSHIRSRDLQTRVGGTLRRRDRA
jgi:hypothetical protein